VKFTVINLDEMPPDLAPGLYCTHIAEGDLREIKVKADFTRSHQPGDCLIQLRKEKKP
jgi:hypothetical protein